MEIELNYQQARQLISDAKMIKEHESVLAHRHLAYLSKDIKDTALCIVADTDSLPFGGGFDEKNFVSATLHIGL